jgi:hypothetical protein
VPGVAGVAAAGYSLPSAISRVISTFTEPTSCEWIVIRADRPGNPSRTVQSIFGPLIDDSW